MPGYHSPRSPSSAHRWRACNKSIQESEGLPDEAGEEAIQGTLFHEYAADCARFGLEPFPMIGSRMLCEDGKHREFTKEMATKMLPGLDLLQSLRSAPGAQIYVEKWVDTSPWVGEGEGGTSDAFVIDLGQRRLSVFDWKWGAGVPVDPYWNDQAMCYVLGVWHSFAKAMFEQAGIPATDIEVKVIIEQPRAPGGGGVWTTQMSTILAEGENIRRDAEATRDPNATYNPGEKQCQFCPAARVNKCKARKDFMTGLLRIEDQLTEADVRVEVEDVIDLVDVRALSPDERSLLLLNQKLITKWLEQLHTEAMKDAEAGRPVPGLKRVTGRNSARAWRDEAKAELLLYGELGEKAYRKKLLTPTMVEDEVGKKDYKDRWSGYVAEQTPSVILVPESHPGKRLKSHDEMLTEALGTDSLL